VGHFVFDVDQNLRRKFKTKCLALELIIAKYKVMLNFGLKLES